jgi:hypothetical protein
LGLERLGRARDAWVAVGFESPFAVLHVPGTPVDALGIVPGTTRTKQMAKFKIGRSAITGRFETVKMAQQQKEISVVETIKTDPKKDK